MSREVCGICWCPYDDITGECACPPPSVQKSTLREAATKALEFIRHMNQHGWMLADYEADMERTVAALRAALAEPVVSLSPQREPSMDAQATILELQSEIDSLLKANMELQADAEAWRNFKAKTVLMKKVKP